MNFGIILNTQFNILQYEDVLDFLLFEVKRQHFIAVQAPAL